MYTSSSGLLPMYRNATFKPMVVAKEVVSALDTQQQLQVNLIELAHVRDVKVVAKTKKTSHSNARART